MGDDECSGEKTDAGSVKLVDNVSASSAEAPAQAQRGARKPLACWPRLVRPNVLDSLGEHLNLIHRDGGAFLNIDKASRE